MTIKSPETQENEKRGGCCLDRLVRHIAMMAPHQKDRNSGKLLIEAEKQIRELREALLLYHEAWNGCERNWHKAMCEASHNADHVLWPNAQGQARREQPRM